MDLRLKDKKVIVLASSKGIGKEIAKQYSIYGASVIVTGRDEATLKATAKEINTLTNNEVIPVVTDVMNPEDVHHVIQVAKTTFGTVDVLINNTGGPPVIDFEKADDQAWYDAFDLTLMSFVRSMKHVLPIMAAQKSGRVVNVASSSVKEPINELLLSNVFRSGVQALGKTLSQQYANEGILINTVGAGKVATERSFSIDKLNAEKHQMDLETWQENIEKKIPMQRYAQTDEFADAVIFLGSFRNTYITGQTLLVDGGMVKAY